MSIALAFMTFGRSISLGIWFIARSTFSLTSMKSRFTLLPGLKVIFTFPASIRDSERMSVMPATCMSRPLSGATTFRSISCAE